MLPLLFNSEILIQKNWQTMIEAPTEFEKQMRQREQARHSALLRQLRTELALIRQQGHRKHRRVKF